MTKTLSSKLDEDIQYDIDYLDEIQKLEDSLNKSKYELNQMSVQLDQMHAKEILWDEVLRIVNCSSSKCVDYTTFAPMEQINGETLYIHAKELGRLAKMGDHFQYICDAIEENETVANAWKKFMVALKLVQDKKVDN